MSIDFSRTVSTCTTYKVVVFEVLGNSLLEHTVKITENNGNHEIKSYYERMYNLYTLYLCFGNTGISLSTNSPT